MGGFFRAVAFGSRAIGMIRHSSLSASVLSSDNYIMLEMLPSPGVVAVGTIWMLHSTANGDFQRYLYGLEGGDSEMGRGDHVGGYGGFSRSFGL